MDQNVECNRQPYTRMKKAAKVTLTALVNTVCLNMFF